MDYETIEETICAYLNEMNEIASVRCELARREIEAWSVLKRVVETRGFTKLPGLYQDKISQILREHGDQNT